MNYLRTETTVVYLSGSKTVRRWLRRPAVIVGAAVLVVAGLWCAAWAGNSPAPGDKKDGTTPAKKDTKDPKDTKDKDTPPKTDKKDGDVPAKPKPGDPKKLLPPGPAELPKVALPDQKATLELMEEMLKAMKKPGGATQEDLQAILIKPMQMNMPGFPGAPAWPQNPLPQGGPPGGGQGGPGAPGGGPAVPGFPVLPGAPKDNFPQPGFPGFGPGFPGLPFQGPFGGPGGVKPFGMGGMGPTGVLGKGQFGKQFDKLAGLPGAVQNKQVDTNLTVGFHATETGPGGAVIDVDGTIHNGVANVSSVTINAGGAVQQFKSLDQVPQAYRPTVDAMVQKQIKAFSQPFGAPVGP
jgi:hypothetical protein